MNKLTTIKEVREYAEEFLKEKGQLLSGSPTFRRDGHLYSHPLVGLLEQFSQLQNRGEAVELLRDAFEQSRLTHPMIGFKYKTFEEYCNEKQKEKCR